MNKIKNLYQDNLIYIFTKNQLINSNIEYLIIIKNDTYIKELDHCLTMHYKDDFESLLKFSLPTKNRRAKQIISLNQCFQIIKNTSYGVLSFCNGELPYSIGLNHILLDDRIFFHCAKSGYKLTGINKRATYIIINDLGINSKAATHNHNSVTIFGTIREVTDSHTKKDALLKLINDLAPNYPYNDKMINTTNILELEIDYINGKSHIR